MASGFYQFSFGPAPDSAIDVRHSIDGVNWTAYVAPHWPPSPQGKGAVLSVKPNDTVGIWLKGPMNGSVSGWAPKGVQIIVARAKSAKPGQAFSPFAGKGVWQNPSGAMDSSSPNVWKTTLGPVTLNPGRGQSHKYEIVIAFTADLSTMGGSSDTFYAEDPELEIEGI